jgi:hypothetical protein
VVQWIFCSKVACHAGGFTFRPKLCPRFQAYKSHGLLLQLALSNFYHGSHLYALGLPWGYGIWFSSPGESGLELQSTSYFAVCCLSVSLCFLAFLTPLYWFFCSFFLSSKYSFSYFPNFSQNHTEKTSNLTLESFILFAHVVFKGELYKILKE